MDYHGDRFEDHSLIFFTSYEKIMAILPANIDNGVLYSHQGLSYGGLLYGMSTNTADVLRCFDSLRTYCTSSNIKSLVYKRVPSIYHQYPSDEDLYALFRQSAQLVRRDIGYVINLDNPAPMSRNKKRYIKNFNSSDYKIEVSTDFHKFHSILSKSLERHETKPVHSPTELKMLTEQFSSSIFLYAMFFKDEIEAFCWMFSANGILHIQNMAASEYGRANHFIDYFYNWILTKFSAGYKYLSFGISTESNGSILNYGLADQKEKFGARGLCHDFFELTYFQ